MKIRPRKRETVDFRVTDSASSSTIVKVSGNVNTVDPLDVTPKRDKPRHRFVTSPPTDSEGFERYRETTRLNRGLSIERVGFNFSFQPGLGFCVACDPKVDRAAIEKGAIMSVFKARNKSRERKVKCFKCEKTFKGETIESD